MSGSRMSQYPHREENDDDHVGLNVLQDAGAISEAMTANDDQATSYDEKFVENSEIAIEMLLAGGLSAGLAVQVGAAYVERVGTDDLEQTREAVEQKLLDDTLTDAQRKALEDFLQQLKHDPELVNARQ